MGDPFHDNLDLRGDGNLNLIMRGHLYAEQLLFALITEALVKPALVDLDRIGFLTKARLAAAMGLIREEVLPPLVVLNNLRNSFAHKVDYKFTDEDKATLFNAFPEYVRHVALTTPDAGVLHTKDTISLEWIMKTLVSLMEGLRKTLVEHKAAEAAAVRRLREEIDKAHAALGRK